MTRIVRDRILKDVNGNISDHLRNHIHLTNCIHLKNHMHKQSPILADRSLMRDLVILQRSRSLRDPSASPPSSPSPVGALLKRAERDSVISNGRRSVGIERPMGGRCFSGSSPQEFRVASSRVSSGEANGDKSGIRERRRVRREESSGRILGNDLIPDEINGFIQNTISRNCEQRDKSIKQNGRYVQDDHIKTLSEQLNEYPVDSDEVASSKAYRQHVHTEKLAMEAEATVRRYCSGRAKRHKFRGARRTRVPQKEMSVASNSLAQGASNPRYHTAEEDGDQNITRAPRNGCGIPWNWSRIHDRGKSFFDLAGRSFSCGLSDSRLKKGGAFPHGKDIAAMPVTSEYTSSSDKSVEALPLLVDPSGSLGSKDNAAWVHDYSGELGIFADDLLKHEIDSDLVSEGRSGEQRKFHRHGPERHQSLNQKYMPRTFRDLVGQHLVAQALFNAVVKRKVGLLYAFYGPHGTGKTSCARIFARALNCQSLEHPKPCGICNSCIAHDMGKSRNIREIGPVSNFDYQNIMDLLDNMIFAHLPSPYRVFIFDDCDSLSPDSWSAIIKVLDRAPRRFVVVLICSSLDVLPHTIISRCQKFFFPKLKDADIIYTLQWIATKEDLEIDKDALKLIATRSDGSLRDAEMTLEQLSLLGLRISVPLVQELVGLISDDKLVDLLDLALSADTVNTVKSLREVMESGVEPLALMSQLATVITDILAGSYDFTKDSPIRRFFRRQALSKDDMEKLRQALKTLSEAEKQLRTSNDRLTWLTAALLQLAPDQQYVLPTSSSAGTSLDQSPIGLNYRGGRERPRKSNAECSEVLPRERTKIKVESFQTGSTSDSYNGSKTRGTVDNRKLGSRQVSGKLRNELEEIWLAVLEKIHINSLKQFLYQEGKLISVSFGTAPTVQLIFSSHTTKYKAEKLRLHILQAFESVVGSPVTIEIRADLWKDTKARPQPIILPPSQDTNGSGQRFQKDTEGLALTTVNSTGIEKNEIIEEVDREHFEGTSSTAKVSNVTSTSDLRKLGDRNQSQSLVRSRVSLAHVIQQAEGCVPESGWSKRKAVSIAEKLEQENLRLEPRSRSLLCWKATTPVSHRKLSRLRSRSRKPKGLLKLVSCGKCLSGRSPRQR
ncbi:PREDICTED: protein STICHEL-like 3 isoform X2 [Ipomoea nil]|uniref:protein STICHEL-like 3 isoform X2 n=1 Tax=Ipomoea nil TaxID=35883 RepID=UPI00090184DC|nr:PREDICTED: protein STICHEL-like 3 isoform X2 [Ipomoea nil]